MAERITDYVYPINMEWTDGSVWKAERYKDYAFTNWFIQDLKALADEAGKSVRVDFPANQTYVIFQFLENEPAYPGTDYLPDGLTES